MDDSKQKILEMFKKRGGDISTAEILAYVYPDTKAVQLREDKDSKRKLAQAHRKLLYHINELVNSGILRFSRFGEKGLKFFTLAISAGEEITELTPRYKKRITVSAPSIPAMPIESYEHQGIVIRYEAGSWIDKLNAVVIMCNKINGVKELENILESALSVVNDCICLENFDSFLMKVNKAEAVEILESINSECKDYNKRICCMINFQNLNKENFNRENLLHIANNITAAEINNLIFIYNIDADEIQENLAFLHEIISVYMSQKRTFYIKNKRLHKAPYFLGTAGPYSISEKEWLSSLGLLEKASEMTAIACSQSSLIVDVEKFYSLYGLDTLKFSELMFNISKSFLSANSLQRRKSQEYFKSIMSFDKNHEKDFLEFSRNYIRFWNYGLMQPGIDPKLVMNMISEAKKKIEQFSIAEETIYKSCGMPIRFKIAVSCAFKESAEKLSEAKYKRLEITNLDDLYKPKTKKEIIEKENVTLMFDGGNDTTFHRSGIFNPEDVLREISVIMNTYKMPLLSYSFGKIKGDLKITSYL